MHQSSLSLPLSYRYSIVSASFVENTILPLLYVFVKNLAHICIALLLESLFCYICFLPIARCLYYCIFMEIDDMTEFINGLKKYIVKDTVTVLEDGKYKLIIRYTADANVDDYVLYVNGKRIGSLDLSKTSDMSAWKRVGVAIDLKAGRNKIELKSQSVPSANLYIDNFTVSKK